MPIRVVSACVCLLGVLLGARFVDATDAQQALELRARDLAESPAFWPTIVKLSEVWSLPSGRTLVKGTQGVVVRVPDASVVRVDLGRNGVHDVPISRTDIRDRANGIRRGDVYKMAPNFFLLVGNKMLDTRVEAPTPIASADIMDTQRYLCVFADPFDAEFASTAKALAAYREVEGVTTVFFPQGFTNESVPEIAARMRELDWAVPMVAVASYTRTLLRPEQKPPYMLVVGTEGELIHDASLAGPNRLRGLDRAVASHPGR